MIKPGLITNALNPNSEGAHNTSMATGPISVSEVYNSPEKPVLEGLLSTTDNKALVCARMGCSRGRRTKIGDDLRFRNVLMKVTAEYPDILSRSDLI